MSRRDERLLAVLQKVAPGTALRDGIDRIIRSGKGAIIVLGNSEEVEDIVSGGFKMVTKFTAQRLSEVAKMDGAIILDDVADKILYANVQLVPDPNIATTETGTRHRTAERTARQTGKPIISVSESMRTVSLYVDSIRHSLEEISSILFRANQALATLERYRVRLDQVSSTLSALEVENVVTLRDVLNVLQRAEMVQRISDEIEAYVAELGIDGRLLQLQHDELMAGVERERTLVVRDYAPRGRDVAEVLRRLDRVPAEELLRVRSLAEALGVGRSEEHIDQPLQPRGYRLLSRIPRLPARTVDRLVGRFGVLERLMKASLEDLNEVEGIGESRARMIREGLVRLAEAASVDHYQ